MNKNHMFSFFILLSLTLQISASVNEIKEKKSYFNFTEETIEKVNTSRNHIFFYITLFIFARIHGFNQLQWPISFISIACTASCFFIGKPASEQPLPPIKKTVAVSVCDRDLMQHYAKNPLVGNVNLSFINYR